MGRRAGAGLCGPRPHRRGLARRRSRVCRRARRRPTGGRQHDARTPSLPVRAEWPGAVHPGLLSRAGSVGPNQQPSCPLVPSGDAGRFRPPLHPEPQGTEPLPQNPSTRRLLDGNSQGDPNRRQLHGLILRSDAEHRVSKDGPARSLVGAPWSVPSHRSGQALREAALRAAPQDEGGLGVTLRA
jgi:hypothetical protein